MKGNESYFFKNVEVSLHIMLCDKRAVTRQFVDSHKVFYSELFFINDICRSL